MYETVKFLVALHITEWVSMNVALLDTKCSGEGVVADSFGYMISDPAEEA